VIKRLVDEDRRPGRFLLTGSANILVLPGLAGYLVGRMEIQTLWPLSQDEVAGTTKSFLDRVLFDVNRSQPTKVNAESREMVVQRLTTGGFPEAVERSDDRRASWFDSYITDVLQRDVRELANVERLHEMPQLLNLLAARTSQLHNQQEIARSFGVPLMSLRRYLALLEASFLIYRLPAWSCNYGKRLTKHPKLHLTDSGLAANLLKVNKTRLLENPDLLGPLLESFVVMELIKQVGWSDVRPKLFYLRTQTAEVDLVAESRDGLVAGVEVKAASVVDDRDFKGLRELRELTGKKFVRGVVLYLGTEVASFGDGMFAVPVSALWQSAKG
jgi:predicted AAA+ superfamily ATPase